MSGEAVDRLRRSIAEFNRIGEVSPDLLPPDFELHQASSIVDTAGIFHGPGAPNASLDELAESFEDLVFEPEEFIEAPRDQVVVLIHVQGRGRGSGIQIDNRIAWVFTFRDGKAARMDIYEERADALKAVGLAG